MLISLQHAQLSQIKTKDCALHRLSHSDTHSSCVCSHCVLISCVEVWDLAVIALSPAPHMHNTTCSSICAKDVWYWMWLGLPSTSILREVYWQALLWYSLCLSEYVKYFTLPCQSCHDYCVTWEPLLEWLCGQPEPMAAAVVCSVLIPLLFWKLAVL